MQKSKKSRPAAASGNEFLVSLLDDLKHNRMDLPVLPEVVLKARKTVQDSNATASRMAKIITADTALSARVVRVANSALLRGRTPVTSVQSAIARMGIKLLRNMITCLVMQQVYQRGATALVDEQLKALWEHGTRVAALSQVIARKFTNLDPEQAMLAGLIHDIGALPILTRAAKVPELLVNPAAMQRIVDRLHPRIGKIVLQNWRFPQEFIDVVTEHENLEYDSNPGPDYVDVVIVANIHSYIGTENHRSKINWDYIPAFAKLGLTPKASIAALNEAQEEVAEIQQLLSI